MGGFLPVALRGIPDAVAMPTVHGVPVGIWIEFKTDTGKLSPHQQQFRELVEDHGGFFLEIRSLEELILEIGRIKLDVLSKIL